MASRREAVKSVAVLAAVLLLLDVGLAQVGKVLVDTWELRAPERTYRIPSELYHHDLAKEADVRATWGGIRYPYLTNSLGFRDAAARRVPLRSGAPRLLLIGDSFTEGVGVAFPKTFAGIVAERLAGKGVEVLNAAVTSYSPAIYYRKTKYLIEELGLELDALVVCLDVSDIEDEARRYRLDSRENVVGIEREQPPSTLGRLKGLIKHNSLLVNLGSRLKAALAYRLQQDDRKALGVDAQEAAWALDEEAFAAVGRDGLGRARENMDRLLDLVRRHRVEMALVVYPWPDQILRRDLDSPQVTFWRSWAEENGVPFLDLFPVFISRGDPRLTIRKYFIPFDFHWNERGHRLVAEALLEGPVSRMPASPALSGASAYVPGIPAPRAHARWAGRTLERNP